MANMSVSVLLALRDKLTGPARRAGRTFSNVGRQMEQAGRKIAGGAMRATQAVGRLGAVAARSAASVTTLATRMRALRTWGRGLGGSGMMTLFGGGLVASKVGSTLFGFENTMNEVQALMSASDQSMKGLRTEVKNIGMKSRYTATQVGQGLVELARAGVYDPEEAKALLDGTVGLAEATNTSMDRAADIATNIAKAFGKDLTKPVMTDMVDSLAHATRRTNFDLHELAKSMEYVAPAATNFGLSMKDTTALLMALAQVGQKGSKAGRGLARVMETAANRATKKPARKALSAIGLSPDSFFDAKGDIKIFDMIEKFREARDEFGKEATAKAMYSAFDSAGARIFMSLINASAEDIEHFRKVMQDADGAVEEMRLARMKGLPGAWYRLVAAMEALTLAAGDKGGLTSTLEGIANTFKEWALSLSQVDPMILKIGSHVVMAAAALGALAIPLMVFGHALRFLAAMALLPMFKGLLMVARPLAGILSGVAMGIAEGAALAGVTKFRAALALIPSIIKVGIVLWGLYEIYNNWDTIKALFEDPIKLTVLWPQMPSWVRSIVEWAQSGQDYRREREKYWDQHDLDQIAKGKKWRGELGAWWGENMPSWLGGNRAQGIMNQANPQSSAQSGVPAILRSGKPGELGGVGAGPTTNNNDNSKTVNVGGITNNITVNSTGDAAAGAVGNAAGGATQSGVRKALNSDGN